ncbi:MAG TPA: hypothetical protein PKY56_08795, partial [Candidatus Kapabacteria bacterium]|nr:hypothetical protein [Candidatus Kapabacteria bacterium]
KATLIFAALAIMFMANMNTKAQCPENYFFSTRTVLIDGCWYMYSFCLGINQWGLHEVKLTDIQILAPCTGDNFEANSQYITDEILKDLADSGWLYYLWGYEIPECPGQLCLVRWYDAICYNGWYYEGPPDPPDSPVDLAKYNFLENLETVGVWKMNKCIDSLSRSCGETIRICWELRNGVRTLVLTRTGSAYGPPCPTDSLGAPCHTNCD